MASGTKVGRFESAAALLGDCSLALSKDGRILCSSHHDKIVVWDVASRQAIRVIEPDSVQHGGRTHGLAIAPDASLVASKALDHKVHVWHVATGEPVFGQAGTHSDAVISVAFSPDGSRIVTGSVDATVRLWDATSGAIAAYCADLRALSGSKAGNQITLWSADGGEQLYSFDLPDGSVRSLAFSPDGNRLASGMDRGDTLVWQLSARQRH